MAGSTAAPITNTSGALYTINAGTLAAGSSSASSDTSEHSASSGVSEHSASSGASAYSAASATAEERGRRSGG